jgi:hypothetical protein
MEGSLRPCLGQGVSRRAGCGRVRSLACLNSLRALREPFATTYALCFPESLNWFSTLW